MTISKKNRVDRPQHMAHGSNSRHFSEVWVPAQGNEECLGSTKVTPRGWRRDPGGYAFWGVQRCLIGIFWGVQIPNRTSEICMSRGHFRVVSCKCISPSKKCLKSNGAPERYATSIITALLAVKTLTTCGLLKWCYLSKREEFCYLAPLTKDHNHLRIYLDVFWFKFKRMFRGRFGLFGEDSHFETYRVKWIETTNLYLMKIKHCCALATQEQIKLVLTVKYHILLQKRSRKPCAFTPKPKVFKFFCTIISLFYEIGAWNKVHQQGWP